MQGGGASGCVRSRFWFLFVVLLQLFLEDFVHDALANWDNCDGRRDWAFALGTTELSICARLSLQALNLLVRCLLQVPLSLPAHLFVLLELTLDLRDALLQVLHL